MTRRRAMMIQKAQQGGNLPSGYTAVNYLQSSGTQYIDTGRKLTQDSDITIDVRIADAGADRDAGVFGSRTSADRNNLSLFRNKSPAVFSGDFSEYRNHRFTTALTPARTKIRMNKNGVWVDDVRQRAWSDVADFETPTNGLIFDVGNNNWAGNKAVMRLYGYSDGDGINLVPCLDADGVPCLYDTVEQQTYYNQGTGSFTWG